MTTSEPIRCLLLDNNVTYVNPTRRLFVEALKRAFDLTIFGPGYVSTDVLEAGPETFVEREGPFHVVIATEQMLLPHYYSKEHLLSGVWRYHAYRHATEWMTSKAPFDFLRSFDGIRIVSFLQTDFYSVKPPVIDLVEEADAFVIGAGHEFLLEPGEELGADGLSESRGLWRSYTTRRSDRVVSLTHMVDASEVSHAPLATRRYDASAPGAHYELRLLAQESLRRGVADLRLPSEVWARNVLRLRNYLRLDGRYLGIKFLNAYFLNILTNSRVVFTSPGRLGFAIRKYFEIPAAGALLACAPCKAFAALGFSDGANATVHGADELADLARDVKKRPDDFQGIADAGRKLVEEQHSVAARAKQIHSAVEAMLNRRFRGSEWKNGQFTLT